MNFVVQAPGVDEAFENLSWYMRDLPWFKNLYGKVSQFIFPEHPAFRGAVAIIMDGKTADWENLKRVFTQEVYQPADYENSIKALSRYLPKLNNLAAQTQIPHDNWGFKLFDKCAIMPVLYGRGADYDWNVGHIHISMTKDGEIPFCKPGDDGAVIETIFHEFVHIGIEDIIVRRFGLTHEQKERVVENLCSFFIKDYRFEKVGERGKGVDSFMSRERIIHDLPAAIEEFSSSQNQKNSPLPTL